MPTICSACGRTSGKCESCSKGADRIAETYADIHPHATIDQRLAMQHAAVYAIQQVVNAAVELKAAGGEPEQA